MGPLGPRAKIERRQAQAGAWLEQIFSKIYVANSNHEARLPVAVRRLCLASFQQCLCDLTQRFEIVSGKNQALRLGRFNADPGQIIDGYAIDPNIDRDPILVALQRHTAGICRGKNM